MTQRISTNGGETFTFNDSVVTFFAGVSSFSFTYGSSDHHVEQLALTLTSSLTSPRQVQVNVSGTLQDASGNSIDNRNSYVYVTVVAWTGANTGGLVMATEDGIADNARGAGISLPSANPGILVTALNGFKLAYAGTDHHVEYVRAGTGAASSGSMGFVEGHANMYDASGNTAATANVNGALLATSMQNLGIYTAIKVAQSGSPVTVDFSGILPSGVTLKSAAVLVSDFHVQYGGGTDHHVQTIGTGCSTWTVSPTSVTLNTAQSFMYDDSGNNQDNGASNVTILVVGSAL
ncbi:MAG TPA: hypothetical protein VIB55_21295 [Longimicrobium sp.]